MSIPEFDFKKGVFYALLCLFSAFVCLHQMHLSGDNAFNSYIFVSSDGLDWIVEGHYLWNSMQAGAFPFDLHVLRPPVYVVFSTLDAMLGGKGYVLSIVSALSLFATVYYCLKFIGNTASDLIVLIVSFILLILAPINYFRLFFQADPLATALSLAASWHIYKAVSSDPSWVNSIAASVLVTLAALSQTYGIIAPSIVLTLYALKYWLPDILRNAKVSFENRKFAPFLKDHIFPYVRKGMIIVVAIVAFILIRTMWLKIIPHNKIPNNFGLLRLNVEMLSFYIQTWAYYLGPIVVLLLGMFLWRRVRAFFYKDTISLAMLAVVLTFMFLLVLYDWKDARFTYYFWPFLIILFVRLSTVFNGKAKFVKMAFLILASVLILSQTTVYFPQSYERPSFAKLNPTAVKKRQSFIDRFRNAGPVDRLILKKTCGDRLTICQDAKIPKGATKYRTRTFTVYLRLHGIDEPEKAPSD